MDTELTPSHQDEPVFLPKPSYCYWSVADGDSSILLASAIASARAVGVTADIHVWSDRPLPTAIHHQLDGPVKDRFMTFKIDYLREHVQQLPYDCYVWIDADTLFVRNPGDVTLLLGDSGLHIGLETNIAGAVCRRRAWWGCPIEECVALMRLHGVSAREVYNVNGGFWIVRRLAVPDVAGLACQFTTLCERNGYTVPADEVGLAYAMMMLCGDRRRHAFQHSSIVFATDWPGHFRHSLPDGAPWPFVEYMTGATMSVNPAIVHAIGSKQLLRARGAAIVAQYPEV